MTLQVRFLLAYSPPPVRAGIGIDRWAAMMQPTVPLIAVAALLAALSPAARSRAAAGWALLLAAAVAAISANGFSYPHYAMLLAVPLTLLLVTQLRDWSPPAGPWVCAVLIGVAVCSLVLPEASVFATGARSVAH